MKRTMFYSTAARLAVAIVVPAFGLALAVSPAANAQSNGANIPTKDELKQLCTGAGNKFDCDQIDRNVSDDQIKKFVQGGSGGGSNTPDVPDSIKKQIKEYEDKLNKGNGAPTTTPTTPGTSPTTTPDLQKLREKGKQYMDSVKKPVSTAPDNGTKTPEDTSKPSETPKQTTTPAERCEKMKQSADERVAKLNKRAQAQLAHLTDVLNKLKAYQSSANASNLPADYQDKIKQAEEAQAKATQAVATLATLSVNIDCSQDKPAEGLSVIKAAVDDARSKLKDFRKSLSDVTGQFKATAPQQP